MIDFFVFDTNVLISAVLILNSITLCRDPKDDKLELAISAKAITDDGDLLVLNPFRKISILNV